MDDNTILLVGCGRMGQALLRGWLNDGLGPIAVIEPEAAAVAGFAGDARVRLFRAPSELPPGSRPKTIVLAVKPQMVEAVGISLRAAVTPDALIVSILAGISLASLERVLGPARLVRAMPNLPASIGRAMTVAVAQVTVGSDQRAQAARLLHAVGAVEWMEDEALIDPVTAVSGSGPAYVFLLVEVMAEAGVKAGLPPDLAMKLARETVSGAGELMRQSDQSAAQLRQNVSSPGGTTLAALTVLTADDRLQSLFDEAIAAAAERARQLGR